MKKMYNLKKKLYEKAFPENEDIWMGIYVGLNTCITFSIHGAFPDGQANEPPYCTM